MNELIMFLRDSNASAEPEAGRLEVGTGGEDRRYVQLVDQIKYFNPAFDHRKFWAYGCNCLLLGTRE